MSTIALTYGALARRKPRRFNGTGKAYERFSPHPFFAFSPVCENGSEDTGAFPNPILFASSVVNRSHGEKQ
jgi:hypothetical protein